MSQIGGTIIDNYAYGTNGGAGVQVVCRWEFVQPVVVSVVDIYLSYQINQQGSSINTGDDGKSITIYINGTSVTTVSYPENGTTGGLRFYGINRCSSGGARINTVRVVASVTGSGYAGIPGAAIRAQATASIDRTITFSDISDTADFVLITSDRFIRLPPINAHNRPIVLKCASAGVKMWIYSRDGAENIDNRRGVYADSSYACVTVFSNGTQWFIAGWYNNPLPTRNVMFPTGEKLGTGLSSTRLIHIFNTNRFPSRRSGDNAIFLPVPGAVDICIIVYAGDTNASRGTDNALLLVPPYGRIDGYPAGTYPFISCDSNVKSTGVVLFRQPGASSSDDKWYIIGWANTSGWTWTTGTSGWHSTPDVPTNRQRIILFPTESWQYMTLPVFTPHQPQLLVYKMQKSYKYAGQDQPVIIGGQLGNNPDTMGNNFLNETQRGIIRNAPSEYVCVWFVSEQRSGETFVRYYPVMTYIPP